MYTLRSFTVQDTPNHHIRLHANKIDFIEICKVLSSVANCPERFEDPEALLYP